MPLKELSDRCQAQEETLLSMLYDLARHSPDNEFLLEATNTSLTYRQTYILVSALLPKQLCQLCQPLSSPRSRKVVLVSPNNALFPLILWSLWFMSFSVIPISVKSERFLWPSMVDLVDPDALFVSRNLGDTAEKYLQASSPRQFLYLEDIIPAQFALQSSSSRQSDFIPSLLAWLRWATDSDPRLDSILGYRPSYDANLPVVTLFTSSAVDAATLKCVTYTHSVLVHSGARIVEMLGGESYKHKPVRHLGWLSLGHCFELTISFIGIVFNTGGTYIFFDRQVSSPDLLLSTSLPTLLRHAIRYHQPVDSFCLVPAIFADMKKELDTEDLENLKAMRSLGVGGAPTSESVFQWAATQGIPYFDCSGATEAAGMVCNRRALVPSMRDHGLQVAPGLEGFLEKESLEEGFGELIIRGTHLPRKYDNKNSDAYSYDSVTGLSTYRTGDIYEQKLSKIQLSLGYVRGEDMPAYNTTSQPLIGLKYIGRIDDLVVLASGVKVDALALERSLNAHPNIVRSAVISDLSRQTLVVLLQVIAEVGVAFIIRRGKELVDFVLNLNRSLILEKRIRPENIIFVDELPTTSKFTLNRKKVKKIWVESLGKWPGSINLDAHTSSALHSHGVKPNIISYETRRRIATLLADIFSIPVEHLLQHSVHFSDVPLTSISSVQLAQALESAFGIKITASQLYCLKSIDDVCALVSGSRSPETPSLDLNSASNSATKLPDVNGVADDALVITGAACRYPGDIQSLSDLWSALLNPQAYAEKVVTSTPPSRWNSSSAPEESIPHIAWLGDQNFNNLESLRDFFNLSPADAENMSPNARLAMQLGYQAIEDAGISPRSLDGQAWGIFSSVNNSGWRERRLGELDLHQYAMSISGSADDAVGSRLSYFLNLTGPAIEIKTACSSSAVAIHQACCAIRNGDCDAAIVIASTTHFHPSGPIFRSSAGIASKTGRCAPFSDIADGFLPSEGAAAIVIQKASDSQGTTYGRIKATHVTQDGRSHGFFAPNPIAQARLLDKTLKKADCSTDDIDYLESHGTGTQIGDAIEMQAIGEVFKGKRTRPLLMGSVKAVLGHTEECAGLTSVLKSLLCLQENAIPPQSNYCRPNPQIDLGCAKICIPRRITAFIRRDRPRLVGISSFGLSGTLAHIILEDSDKIALPASSSPPSLFLLSADSQATYESLLARYAEYAMFPSALEADFEGICRTSQIGRDHLALRRAWPVHDHHSWSKAIFEELREPRPHRSLGIGNTKVGLWFGLPLTHFSLEIPNYSLFDHELALVAEGRWDTRYTFFAQQLTIANVLRAIGCQITAVGGEGMAEWVAAAHAGILQLNSVFQRPTATDGLEVYSLRGSKEKITEILTQWTPAELSLRGRHGTDLFTVEGTAEAAKDFAKLGEFQLSPHPLLASVEPPSIATSHQALAFVSGYLCDVLDGEIIANSAYWTQVTRNFIDSPQALKTLSSHCDLIVNIGGSISATERLGEEKSVHFGGNNFDHLLGQLYERGCALDWSRFGTQGRRLHLPVHQWVS